VNRTLSAGLLRSRRRPYSFSVSVRSAASAPAIWVIAVVGVLVIASEQTWRTALFATVIAAVIAATRVRFALPAAAALLVVLAVLAAAGAGVGAGHPVRAGSRPTGHVSTRAAARPARGRAGWTRAPRHHRPTRGR